MRSQMLAGACTALLLSACSLMPQQTQEQGYAARSERQRAALQNWIVKASLRTQDRRASMRWQQSPNEFNVLLRGPFGFGSVRVSGNAQQVLIDDGETRQISDNPQQDIYQRTGMIVPIAALPYWLRGLPSPHSKSNVQRDELGHLIAIQQDGWSLQYQEYAETAGIAFPMLVEMQNAPWMLQVNVSKWQLE